MMDMEPPENLYGNILAKIEFEKKRIARVKLAIFGITALVFVFALIPIYKYTAQEFYNSGFLEYLSVLFSDGNIAAAYWKEMLLSLAESLPLFSLTATLSVVFVITGSIKLALKNIGNAFLQTKFA
ncbi:MAG: hypothetical protein Q7R75_01420 [bacterium]|nr:hypothetical protein [bacterium]